MNNKFYENIVVGAGIAGCSLSFLLKKYSNSILLIDKNSDVAFGASGAAGAFLSPLLGKPNNFKDLITKALAYSVNFYKENFSQFTDNCGTCRIPKNQEDAQKFESYIPYMDFEYKKFEDGYLFEIGTVVNSYEICKELSKNIEKKLNFEVIKIEKIDDFWILNDEIKCKNLFLTTGADITLIEESYFNIRAVWGQKIDILSTSETKLNYHKECSLSKSKKVLNKNLISIGATHNRFENDMADTSYNLNLKDTNQIEHNEKTKKIINQDIEKLLAFANDIKTLEDVEVIDIKIGARASSVDYFPLVGSFVNSKKSIEKFPHIKNGSFIKDENLIMYENLYVLNGVGGRGFVLSPYLSDLLVKSIYENEDLPLDITTPRMFKRWVKKTK